MKQSACKTRTQTNNAACETVPLQCAIPGVVVDAKEVTPRFAIRVFVLHLAKGILIGEHTSL